MALVTLKSDLSRIRRKFGSNTKTAGNTDISKRVGVKKDLNTAILPRTNMLDSNGNVQINYDEKNKFQVPIDRSNSKLEIHWDSAKDSYYAKGPTNDILGLKKESRLGSPNQPYVIREIGQRWDGSDVATYSNTVDFFRGGASTLAGRVAGDSVRTFKFLTDNPGFTVKQYGLQAMNVGGDLGKRANIYNPISPLLNTVPLLHFKRHSDQPYSDIIRKTFVDSRFAGPFRSDKENARYKSIGSTTLTTAKFKFGVLDSKIENSDPTSFGTDYTRKNVKIVDGIDVRPNELNRYSISKYAYDGTGDKVNLIPYGNKTEREITTSENSDFVPFRFKDVNNNKYIIFRALLSGITDNMTPEFAAERYVGRPDQVYVYQGTNREISFTFDVYPKTRQELPVLWEKMNYLVGLVYPSWAPSSGGLGMIAPFIELTIGDMYKDTPGFLSQLSLTVQDGTTWEIDDWKLPKYIQAACSFTYIGKYLPNQIGKHYELPWLEDSNTEIGTFYDIHNKETTPERAVGKEYPARAGDIGRLFGELGQPQ